MKVSEAMTRDVRLTRPDQAIEDAAKMMAEVDTGVLPVGEGNQLIGMITDRDLCCSIVAEGLDPKTTTIDKYVSADLVTCRDGENLGQCERAMQMHQLRRIPVVDVEGCVIGIVSQADLALKEEPEKVSRILAEVSRPVSEAPSSIAA